MYGGPHVLLARAVRERIAPDRLPALLLLLAKMGLSVPAGLAARARDRLWPLPPLAHPPLFVVGHYRSGTTLVHKLLAADPRFGSVDTFDLLFPFALPPLKRAARPALQLLVDRLGIRQGFFHDYALRLDDPNEVEPWLLATGSEWSSYWGYLFPARALAHLERFIASPGEGLRDEGLPDGWKAAYDNALRRAARRVGGLPLVVKDPPNTGRVAALTELWPGACFVHVVRDPRYVLLSMRTLWHDTILPRFALQRISPAEVERVVLAHYETVMGAWLRQRDAIPPGRLVEVRYADLVTEPLAELERVYAALSLSGFQHARPAIAARLERDRAYRGRCYAAHHELPAGWEKAVERWGSRLGVRGGR